MTGDHRHLGASRGLRKTVLVVRTCSQGSCGSLITDTYFPDLLRLQAEFLQWFACLNARLSRSYWPEAQVTEQAWMRWSPRPEHFTVTASVTVRLCLSLLLTAWPFLCLFVLFKFCQYINSIEAWRRACNLYNYYYNAHYRMWITMVILEL